MNKVNLRCEKDSSAKFLYASKRMFTELKLLKVILYLLAAIPVILQMIPAMTKKPSLSFMYTLISFGLTVLNEVLSTFLNNHKEMAILEHQLYESEITGSTFSKIEYDRESTNALNELAIRKGLPGMRKAQSFPITTVPQEISDDYSYLYLCRKSAANTNFLLGRMFVLYVLLLVLILCGFAGCMFIKKYENNAEYLKLIIGFYPLVIPFIRNCAACKKCQKNCVKICADIDNFFADGDASVERLARFYYYTQNIEFEMLVNRPAIYAIFPKMFKHGISILQDGVTARFIEAIDELKGRSKGTITQARGKGLITKNDLSLVDIEKRAKEREKERKRLELEQQKLELEKQKIEEKLSGKISSTPAKKTASKTTAKPKTTRATSTTSKSSSTKKTTSKKTTSKK